MRLVAIALALILMPPDSAGDTSTPCTLDPSARLVSANLAQSAYSASSSYGAHTPERAFDADVSTFWNATDITGWIEVDLGNSVSLACITMTVLMTPNGNAAHQVWTSGSPIQADTSSAALAAEFVGFHQSGEVFTHTFVPETSARHLQIRTPQSISWAAWTEIAVYASCRDLDSDGFYVDSGCGTLPDCDDANADTNPGAAEVCNSVDDNCNAQVDEDELGVDSDADGVPNACDNCRLVFNSSQVDTDYDGLGNVCDNCPTASNTGQADTDVDGTGDACDECTDTDGDGYGDPTFVLNECSSDNCPAVANPGQEDADGDAIGSACDSCPLDPANDADGDLVCGDVDNCRLVANSSQTDADGDAIGDACDNCPATPNLGQADSDGEGRGDVCDNCVTVANLDQANQDGDQFGSACDNCPLDFNPNQGDNDGDLDGDACDNCLFVPNPDQTDADTDFVGDICDNCPGAANSLQQDMDSDGVGNTCDNCIMDRNSGQTDRDSDSEGDRCDVDDGLIFVFISDPDFVEWQEEQGYEAWNFYRGDLGVLRASGQYTQEPGPSLLARRDCGETMTQAPDPEMPAADAVAIYLVTGIAGGVEASLGTDSAGNVRPNTNPCP